jgi:Fe-S-cluster-containing dehydrogenase component
MKKWNMIVDVALCENCNNCTLATKDEYVGNEFPGYAAPQPLHGHRWIDIKRKVRGASPMVDAAHVPTMCNHCDDSPCVRNGSGAVKKREDGIVIIDPQKAKGRRDLVESCPYGAIWWNEELQLPQHWNFDAHLLDQGWQQPRGAHACPTGALKAIKIEDSEMQALAEKERLEVLQPERKTKPRVYYKNLHRYSKCFIGGSVTAMIDGVRECVDGATIKLRGKTDKVDVLTSDTFGDFKFDSIEPNSGAYVLTVSHSKHGRAEFSVDMASESIYAGDIMLG